MDSKLRNEMTDTIKINREMLREAVKRNSPEHNSEDAFLQRLENELFGPPKPREWEVWIDDEGLICQQSYQPMTLVKVREILDE